MTIQVKYYCCCFSLRSVCLAYSFWSIIFAGVEATAVAVAYNLQFLHATFHKYSTTSNWSAFVYVQMTINVMRLISAIFLCYGIRGRRSRFFLPDLVMQLIKTAAHCYMVAILINGIKEANFANPIPYFIIFILCSMIMRTYFGWCVIKLYVEWTNKSVSNPRSTPSELTEVTLFL